MTKLWKRPLGKVAAKLLAVALVVLPLWDYSAMPTVSAEGTMSISDGNGYEEGAYAKWGTVDGADSYKAYVSSNGGEYVEINSAMIRESEGCYRVDEVGLAAGNCTIKVEALAAGNVIATATTQNLTVRNYDRSGYAHFNYTEGVGAYKDNGTLKDNAIVLYVTDANKDTVSVTSKDGTKVTGIGHILNSVGMDVGTGVNSKGGKANNNSGIIKKLAQDGTPLVVRIIGTVTTPEGLTAYDSVDYGGSEGDNGCMARMQSGKDITIEGIGSDAVIDGWGIHFIRQTSDTDAGKSFEVRNISFKNVPEDCVGMEGQQESSTLTAPVERCWVHDCAFYGPTIANPAETDKDGGDGACDFKRGQYFTNSYCYYEGYHKTNLVGSSDSSLQYHLTYHHNYWKDCDSRGPLARQADIHMYNNIYEGQTSKTMDARANSFIFSEYNTFINCKNPAIIQSGAMIKSYQDSFTCCIETNAATVVEDKSETVSSSCKYANFDTDSSVSYVPSGDYLLHEDLTEVRQVITAYTGTLRENPVSPEDVSTSVILEGRMPSEAVSLPYSQALNKTYVTSASSTVDNIVFNVAKLNSDSLTVGSNTTGQDIVFAVNTAFNVTMEEVSATYSPVLCNDSGIGVLTGSGTVKNLPAGVYYIQSGGYDVGSGKYKEAKIASLAIEAYDPNEPTYTITVQNDGNGTARANMTTATKNTKVSLTATPNTGYEFDTWQVISGDVTVSENKFVMPASDVTVKALFKEATSSGGGTGGGTGGTGGVAGTGYVHNFTESGLTNGYYTFTNCKTSTDKGTVTYNGLKLTTCLKIESKTNVAFTSATAGTLVLVLDAGSTKSIKIDGASYAAVNGIVTAALQAGSHTITKADSVNCFYMEFILESSGAGGDVSGGDVTGGDVSGGDVTGGDVSGGDVPGGDVPGGDNDGTGDGTDKGTGDGTDKGTGDGKDDGTIDGNDKGLKVRLANPGQEYVYTGSAIKPAIVVTNNGEKLTAGVDYTVQYTNNVKASANAKITVTGKGNLSGKNSTTFTIKQKDLNDADVKKGAIVVVKNSKATPVLTYNHKKLGTKDYTYANGDKTKKFTENGTITIEGKGNFTGSCTLDVKVVDKLQKFTVTLKDTNLTYDGKGEPKKPTVVVTDKSGESGMTEGEDYEVFYSDNVVDAGTVKVTVIGQGLYTGTVTKSYKIKPLAVKEEGAMVVDGVDSEGYGFAGKAVTIGHDLTVTCKTTGEVLTEGKDYKISYSSNKKVGTGKYTIKFQGNYKGSKALKGTFTIKPMPLTDEIEGLKIVVGDKVYSGKPGTYVSKPLVSINGVMLKASDYKVTYYKDADLKDEIKGKNKMSLEEGEASKTIYVKIVGKGNYAPSKETEYATASYELCKKPVYDLSKAKVTFWNGSTKLTKMEYTGNELEPTVKVQCKKNGKGQYEPVPEELYEVSYVNNVNKGTASVVITANGTTFEGEDCAGSKTAKFKIVAKNLSLSDFLKNLFGL